jgi:chromosome segregation ATPase
MPDENIFRTALSGFNKNDVISFITELNNENEAQKAEYEKRTKEMREFIDQRESEVSELKIETERFQKELREAKARADYAECELELLRARITSFDNEIAGYEAKISELTLSLNALTATKDDFLNNKNLYLEKIDQLNETVSKRDFTLDELLSENNNLKSEIAQLFEEKTALSTQIEEFEKAKEQQKEGEDEQTETAFISVEEDALLKRIDELSELLDLKQNELELSKRQNRLQENEIDQIKSEYTSKIAYLEDKLTRAEQNARTNEDFSARAILEVANIIKDARNRADTIVNDTIKNVDDTKMVVVNLKDSVSGASSVVGDAMARIVNVFGLLSKAIENAETELINSKNDF